MSHVADVGLFPKNKKTKKMNKSKNKKTKEKNKKHEKDKNKKEEKKKRRNLWRPGNSRGATSVGHRKQRLLHRRTPLLRNGGGGREVGGKGKQRGVRG